MNIHRKTIVLAIVGLFIGAGTIPTINGYNFETIQRNVYVSSVSDDDGNGDSSGNFTFDDYADDVICYNLDLINGGIYRTDEKPNVNIISGGYSNDDGNVTLALEVEGVIEDRGNFSYYNNVIYDFEINSSENWYTIQYCNKTCELYYDDISANLTNFVVDGSTLSVTFSLNNPSETINSMQIGAFDLNIDMDTIAGGFYLDAATNIEHSMDIKITKPDNSLYLFNRKILPLSLPVVIGKINVEYEEILNETDMVFEYRELYIDDELIATPNFMDNNLTWDKFSFGKHTLKVLAFDDFGNRASDEIEVWKFF